MPSLIANSRKALRYDPPPVRMRAAPVVMRGASVFVAGRPSSGEGYEVWLARVFPSYTRAPLAEQHHAIWRWAWALEAQQRARSLIAVLPRGGAKSTTAELVCGGVGMRQTRRYALYVSETQEQADKHVMTIATMLERAGVERALNRYGSSRGWRRNQLRTADGYKVDAIGLDTAARGVKVDEDRPDLIVIDDVDGKHDTPMATERKIESLTTTVLPAMAPWGVVLGVQNLLIANGIFAQLLDGRAEFLVDRDVIGPYPAIVGLEYTQEPDGGFVITKGEPTWAGQDVATCNHYLNVWGPLAFLQEAQHEVGRAGQYFVTWDKATHVIRPIAHDGNWIYWGAFDYGYAHLTVFLVFGMEPNGDVHVMGEWARNQMDVAQNADGMRGVLASLGLTVADLRDIVAGTDVFSQDQNGNTIADDYQKSGFVFQAADTNRINGWAKVRERLADPKRGHRPTLYVWQTCTRVIEDLPKMVADPKRLEDVLKVNCTPAGVGGDDAPDALRYGVMDAPVMLFVPPPAGATRQSPWKEAA